METNCIKENGVVGSDSCVKENTVAVTDTKIDDTKEMDDDVSGEVEIIDNDSDEDVEIDDTVYDDYLENNETNDVKCHEEEEEEDDDCDTCKCGETCIYGNCECPSKRHRRAYEAWRLARDLF